MTLLFVIIILALVFDFINGFHDSANSIATVVSTKVLTPLQAVIWAAGFNFVAFFIAKYIIGSFGIADTVAKTVIPEFVTLPIVLAGLVAAIIWNLFTWWFGIPSSSSHTLIGGFAGAAIAAVGFNAIHSSTILLIIAFIFLAPLIGMAMGILINIIILYCAKNTKPNKANIMFKKLQLVSSALLSIGHGLNDSQKVMGIIATTLIAFNAQNPNLPHWLQLDSIDNIHDWVPFSCFAVIGLGTLMGGWKIIKTMGNNITKIQPLEGFGAQTASALTLFLTEVFHVPVSTTHTITGSIIGVGATKRLSAVRWGVTKSLLTAWILTIPVSAVLAMIIYKTIALMGIA